MLIVALTGCRSEQGLGPADSYLLLVPAEKASTGRPVLDRLALDREPGLTLGRILNDGFGAEMVRTVHLAKQLVRRGGAAAGNPEAAVQAAAADPLCLVIGRDEPAPSQQGLAMAGWLGGPEEHPRTRWVGLSGNVEGDKALVQSVTGRLAAHAADWIARGAKPGPAPLLVDAYRMAMEVIAREWRAGQGPATGVPSAAGTMEQRRVFASVRENRGVLAPDGRTLQAAGAMLADPVVAATVLHRLAQTPLIARRSGSLEIYAPFVAGELPAGVNPAQVLGPVRNFQAKLFSAWARAIGAGRPPADIVDLVEAYAALFPAERPELVRIFLATTFAATVVPGGVSRDPADSTQALARLAALGTEIAAGGRGLRDALAPAPSNVPPAPAPGKRR